MAKRLIQEKNAIIQRWEKLVRSEFAEAEKETKPHLINSLPDFLNLLVDALNHCELNRFDFQKLKKLSQEHAEDRALFTRYTIEHVIREYDYLRKVIFEILETEQILDVTSRDIILNFIHSGQTHATCEFAEIVLDKERKIRIQLEEKEQVFKTIFELAAAGKAIIDFATGRFLQVNRRLCEMLSYTQDEMLQKSTEDLTHPDDKKVLINKLPSDFLNIPAGKVWTIEKRYLQKDGTPLWAMISGTLYPPSADQPPRIIATIFDITEKKQIENLKDQFISTLTHDLRTPLSVIDMSGQLLLLRSSTNRNSSSVGRGFAGMDEEEHRRISAKGGRASHGGNRRRSSSSRSARQ